MLIVKEIKRICIAAPSSWEGTSEKGQRVYIRYRHGELTLRLGDPPNEVFVFESQLTDEDDSFLSFSELKETISESILLPDFEIDAVDEIRFD